MSGKFKIAETDNYLKSIEKINDSKLYSKIKTLVYPAIIDNPFYGQNIKKLKGKFDNIYRFRIGKYRMFYTISENKGLIFIIEIVRRKDAY